MGGEFLPDDGPKGAGSLPSATSVDGRVRERLRKEEILRGLILGDTYRFFVNHSCGQHAKKEEAPTLNLG